LARSFPNRPLAAILEGYGNFSAVPPYERLLHYIFFASFVARSIDLNLIDLDNTRQIAEVHPSYRGEYNVSIDIVRFVV
jgi:hypothetical protein